MSNDFEAALASLYNEAMSALPNLDKVDFTQYKTPKGGGTRRLQGALQGLRAV